MPAVPRETSNEFNVFISNIARIALEEDLGPEGDITTACLSCSEGKARIIVKADGVIAGLRVATEVFRQIDDQLKLTSAFQDGASVKPGDEILTIVGNTAGILSAERTALNFLQRLSGIATLTSRFVQAVAHTKTRILDTRKTTPGLRLLEKYAIRAGGGTNHRFGLYDMFLIKENHIRAAGNITNAVAAAKKSRGTNEKLKIEVEVTSLSDLREALAQNIDRVLLDNMNLEAIKQAVKIAAARAETEVSGGVTLDDAPAIAETGVDFISVGALTHSAPALDLSLLLD